jgi:SP family general alpha glucoside:H+ symporter-like MFS transporter
LTSHSLNDIGAVGNIIGALGNGYFTPKYGHRKVMLVNLVAMTGFIFIVFFSPNLPVSKTFRKDTPLAAELIH